MNGVLNRLSVANVPDVAKALLRLNLVRMRGVFAKAVLRAQLASPGLSPVFAALVAVVGSRLPVVAELIVNRLVAQLRAAYSNQDRVLCFATARFIAQLFNQQVVTELLVLEFMSTCLLDPSDGSVELAVVTLRECPVLLAEKAPKALEIVFQRLRDVLQDGDLSRRVEVIIEDLMAQRRASRSQPVILDGRLDLLDEEDVITHFASLEEDEDLDVQYECNAFQFDPDFDKNEKLYEEIKKDILGIEVDEHWTHATEAGELSGTLVPAEGNNPTGVPAPPGTEGQAKEKIVDMTDADLVDFRRTIYLTIGSGLSYEEWAHKLLRLMRKNPGKEVHLCQMIIECCSQEKTFLASYGLLAQRFCLINRVYASNFEEMFATHYATIHRFDTRKIRNIANLYASLLASDALPWSLFELVRIVEDETTSSSRIFLKIMFQEIYKTLGAKLMREKFSIADLQGNLKGVFPTDTADNARFSINFFTSIGLGNLTEDLRERLKSIPSKVPELPAHEDDDGSSSSSLSSSSLSSSSLSPSSGSEAEPDRREETSRPPEDSVTGKRDQSQSSIAPSERPAKSRRRGADSASVLEGEPRRSPPLRGGESSPRRNRTRSRSGSRSLSRRRTSSRRSDDVGHASSSSGARRVTAEPAEEIRRDLELREREGHRNKKSPPRSERRGERRSPRSSRHSRRRYDSSSDSDSGDRRRRYSSRRNSRYSSDSEDEYRRRRRHRDYSDDESAERKPRHRRQYADDESDDDSRYRNSRSRSRTLR